MLELHFRQQGSGEPVIILHGLFGTLDNWSSQATKLAQHFSVWSLDLRNHGRSPWHEEMDYPTMAEDVLNFMRQHQIPAARLVGHSMGGKVAMQLALNHPERVERLCVVDIAPVAYPPRHLEVFAALGAVPLKQIKSRREAEEILVEHIDDAGTRQFLLKNLYRDGDHFAWRMNLKVLMRAYEALTEAPHGQPYEGPTLFIKGGNSDYLTRAHQPAVARLFPNAEARVIEGVGHWPHAEKPDLFNRILTRFLQDV